MSSIAQRLEALATPPALGDPGFQNWLTHQKQFEFIKANFESDNELVVYAGFQNTFMYAVLVPAQCLDPPDAEDLLKWNGNAFGSWGVLHGYGPERTLEIAPPLSSFGSRTIEAGEPIVFLRDYDGLRTNPSTYVELLQKFAHVSGLHFMRERSAWCRLDPNGDVVDMARIIQIGDEANGGFDRAVVVDRRLLDEYAAMTDSVVVQMFDFTNVALESFSGWADSRTEPLHDDSVLIYRRGSQPNASFARGVQIVRSRISKVGLLRSQDAGKPTKYISFIAWDWKNKVVKDVSCAPDALANYFTTSEKPFETSPAFFRPEVLLKYKADTEKYTLATRSISCRGAWHLQSYDINAAGQVHTYLVYLGRLPYEEQHYWRSFNEAPKGGLSQRAVKTDFEGSWEVESDVLEELRTLLHDLRCRAVPWWHLRAGELLRKLTYPVTTSKDEWAEAISVLDQVVVEGLEEKWLRRKLSALSPSVDDRLRALKLLENCLTALGFEPDHARALLGPFHDVHNLRSNQKSHAPGTTAREEREGLLEKHKTFRAHFEYLCQSCLESLTIIDRALAEPESRRVRARD